MNSYEKSLETYHMHLIYVYEHSREGITGCLSHNVKF